MHSTEASVIFFATSVMQIVITELEQNLRVRYFVGTAYPRNITQQITYTTKLFWTNISQTVVNKLIIIPCQYLKSFEIHKYFSPLYFVLLMYV